MLHIVFELTLENTTTFEDNLSLTLFLTLDPLSLISSLIDCVLSVTVSEAIFDLTFVATTIRPFIVTFPCDTVVSELSFVDYTVCPGESAFTAE